MLASHLVEVNELTPPMLCNFIETKHYLLIRPLLQNLTQYAEDMQEGGGDPEKITLVSMLFYKLKDELEQLTRNDTLILFPAIRNRSSAGAEEHVMSFDTVSRMHQKIIGLLEKLRQQVNSYVARPGWSHEFRVFCDELLSLEQHVMQAIYLKENVLLPRLQSADKTISNGHTGDHTLQT